MDAETREYIRREIDRKARSEQKRVKREMAPPKHPLKIKEALLPTEILFTALREVAESGGWGDTPNMMNAEIARRTGYDTQRIKAMADQKTISFDVADYIISRVNPRLWFTSDCLFEVYTTIDLRLWEPEYLEAIRRERANEKSREYHARSKERESEAYERRLAERVKEREQKAAEREAMGSWRQTAIAVADSYDEFFEEDAA